MTIEIDNGSGFCFGVTTAIRKAEEELQQIGRVSDRLHPLYCLGDIVHNTMECQRLERMGLNTITHADLSHLSHAKVLLRAHGEPPSTYALAQSKGLQIVDATCPVVLQLQKRIKQQYHETPHAQIVIFGKNGHAEVLGLVGQTDGKAIVIEHVSDLDNLDYARDIYLYSQTTMSLDEYRRITDLIRQRMEGEAAFHSFDTICRQVAHRISNIAAFAARHDVIVFVCGRKSSNGKALFAECQRVNSRSYQVESADEIEPSWFTEAQSVGICGATSTPKWLMEECKERIEH